MDQSGALALLNRRDVSLGNSEYGPSYGDDNRIAFSLQDLIDSLPSWIKIGEVPQLGSIIQGGQAVADPSALLAAWSADYAPADFYRYDENTRGFIFGGHATADEERIRAAAKLGYEYLPSAVLSDAQQLSDVHMNNPGGHDVSTPFGVFRQTADVGSVARWQDLGRAESSWWSALVGKITVGLTLAGFGAGLSELFTGLGTAATASTDVAYDVGANLVNDAAVFGAEDIAYDVGANLLNNPAVFESSMDVATLAQTAKTAASIASGASTVGTVASTVAGLIKVIDAVGNAKLINPGEPVPDGYHVAPNPAVTDPYRPPFDLSAPIVNAGGPAAGGAGGPAAGGTSVNSDAAAPQSMLLFAAVAGVAVYAVSKMR